MRRCVTHGVENEYTVSNGNGRLTNKSAAHEMVNRLTVYIIDGRLTEERFAGHEMMEGFSFHHSSINYT